jgi:hypothetical protein
LTQHQAERPTRERVVGFQVERAAELRLGVLEIAMET